MRWTINLDCKIYKTKNNSVPILLRVSINGTHDYINTGRKINVNHYDPVKKCIKHGINGYNQYASFINSQKGKIDDIIKEFDDKGDITTPKEVKEIYENGTGKSKAVCFFQYVEETIQWERTHTQITKGTITNYLNQLRWLKNYVRADNNLRGDLNVHQINKKVCEGYFTYVREVMGLKESAEYKAKIFMRKYVKKLFDTEVIKKYPFRDISVGGPGQVEIEYLTIKELSKLHDLFMSGQLLSLWRVKKSKHSKRYNIGCRYQMVLKLFLISCYTGLRFSDSIRFHSSPHKFIKGEYIVMELQKGRLGKKKQCRIPLRRQMNQILGEQTLSVAEIRLTGDRWINLLLREILEIAGINKYMTFHGSRHTFAIVSLLLGMKMEVINNILCHSDLKTTQRYARVVDELRDQEMDKWDSFAKEELSSSDADEVICPSCENIVTKLDTATIQLRKIPMSCPFCSASFNYDMKEVARDTYPLKVSMG